MAGALLLALAVGACGEQKHERQQGLDQRPRNPSCLAPSTPAGMPEHLGDTGCFAPTRLREPAAGLIPYTVIAPLWSDRASKERYIALPDEGVITVGPDGDFDLPAGTVLAKVFVLDGAPVETRLFLRHADGAWAGYSYAFAPDGRDATLVGDDAAYRTIGQQEWQFPGRQHCLDCHTGAAGFTLGLELAQLDRDFTYPTGRTANQLATFAAIGLFAADPPAPAASATAPPLLDPFDATAPLPGRARSYLHANCANCHRPGGVREPNVAMDLRHSVALVNTAVCDLRPNRTDLGMGDAKLLFLGNPELSIISLRMHTPVTTVRMPPVASTVVDLDGTRLVDDWIRATNSCQE
jgi:uncharacterized repeat protein (TIGR03806 family)